MRISRRILAQNEVSDFEWLMMEIDRIGGCKDTKIRILGVMRAMAGHRLFFSKQALTKQIQINRAMELMAAGNSMAQCRDQLISRFGCKKSKAYEIIKAALEQRKAH
jgi:hypothetical protein